MTAPFASALVPFTAAERGESPSLPEALDTMGRELRHLHYREMAKRYDTPPSPESKALDLRKLGESGS